MGLSSVCGLLLLCVHLYWVNAENIFDGFSSHNVQRRDASSKWNFTEGMGTKMTVSPTWYVSAGDTVVIDCFTHNDKGNYSDKMDLQLVWTNMSLGQRTKKVVMSRRASVGISYVLSNVTHEHQGVYTCVGDGSFPHVYVLPWHHILWVTDNSSRASMDVSSHNRRQFFPRENFTLSCQLPDDNTQWKMRSFDNWEGTITECPSQVFSGRRLSCTFSPTSYGPKLYWCQTPHGERSNALNITARVVTAVALESPTLPVMEGEDVMLRCVHRDRSTHKITDNFSAIFYKDDRLIIKLSSTGRELAFFDGNMTLTAVTKADEGFYKCRHVASDEASTVSWLTVKARPDDDQEKTDDVTKTP